VAPFAQGLYGLDEFGAILIRFVQIVSDEIIRHDNSFRRRVSFFDTP
jgi:hypothetical protein